MVRQYFGEFGRDVIIMSCPAWWRVKARLWFEPGMKE
jgi:hypothetical protein